MPFIEKIKRVISSEKSIAICAIKIFTQLRERGVLYTNVAKTVKYKTENNIFNVASMFRYVRISTIKKCPTNRIISFHKDFTFSSFSRKSQQKQNSSCTVEIISTSQYNLHRFKAYPPNTPLTAP